MPGSIQLFRLWGIRVFLHWSWLLVAFYQIKVRNGAYDSVLWSAAEYVALFCIVLMHEFGHALACLSVGGRADRIMLWPLGGVAYVQPPPRPGPMLWSIAAGPLVNLVLVVPLYLLAGAYSDQESSLSNFLSMLAFINIALLVFNMLPIYPLDGGQILRALLWFVVGPQKSLKVASVIGLAGAAAGLIWAISVWEPWIILMAAFAGMSSWAGFQQSRKAVVPLHSEFVCPNCHQNPPSLPIWGCDNCGQRFDTFDAKFQCPRCGKTFPETGCPHCNAVAPSGAWIRDIK
ncbi:MAG: M50 family metallopeptidase [Burkholderiales bacterium]|nr:M50 family metallopeptidase [Phycisphaerae bacterium]